MKKILLREADEILEFVKGDGQRGMPDLADRVDMLNKLPEIFSRLNDKEKKALLGRHLHRTLLIAMQRGENVILSRIAHLFATYDKGQRVRFGLDEETEFKLYRAGIYGWFDYPQAKDGILDLWQWPRDNLGKTVEYLDRRVRAKYPELSKSIDIIIEYATKKYRVRQA